MIKMIKMTYYQRVALFLQFAKMSLKIVMIIIKKQLNVPLRLYLSSEVLFNYLTNSCKIAPFIRFHLYQ